jgi:hypothetical protein
VGSGDGHDAGISQVVAMSMSGHRTSSMFFRYGIKIEDEQRAAMAATAAYHQKKTEDETEAEPSFPSPSKRLGRLYGAGIFPALFCGQNHGQNTDNLPFFEWIRYSLPC